MYDGTNPNANMKISPCVFRRYFIQPALDIRFSYDNLNKLQRARTIRGRVGCNERVARERQNEREGENDERLNEIKRKKNK